MKKHNRSEEELNLDEIKEQLKKEGWSLASPKKQIYVNACQPLTLVCPEGHTIIGTWPIFQQQLDGGLLTCSKCESEIHALKFLAKMVDRGFFMDVNLYNFQGQGQTITGTCSVCQQNIAMKFEHWLAVTECPHCGRQAQPRHKTIPEEIWF